MRFVTLPGFRDWAWLAPACGVLLLAAAGLHWGVSPRWQAQAEDSFERAAASARVVRVGDSAGTATQQRESADSALAALPHESGLAKRLNNLLRVAVEHGLRLGDAEVSYPANDVTGTVRWRVALPVQGRYADLRLFMQAALAADPSLSLEQLRISRLRVDDAEVQAQLVWALYAATSRAKTP